MDHEKMRFVQISENVTIPIPRELTSAQEAQWVANYKRDHNLSQLEADYREFGEAVRAGELIAAEQVLKELGSLTSAAQRGSA